MVTDKPRAPKGLAPAGAALWRSITGDWVLDQRELALLTQACRTLDLIADLEALVTERGLVVEGSVGQMRLNGAVTEIRGQRTLFEKLMASLSLPLSDEESPRVSRRAQLAAQRRWQG